MSYGIVRGSASALAFVSFFLTSVSAAYAGWGSSGGSWGGSGGSGGSWGSHGSSGASWSSHGSSGGSWGSNGSSGGSSGGGLFSRWRANRQNGSWGSSGGSNGSHGSYGSWGSGGASWGSGGSTGGVASGNYYSSAPEGTYYSAEASNASSKTFDGVLTVTVPEDAKVFVNGVQTKSAGGERRYVSRNLVTGLEYTYDVRVLVERAGKTLEETKTITLQGGAENRLAFNFAEAAPAAVATTVMLNVPADAKVYLAGHESKMTGAQRTFTTDTLASGDAWRDYAIRVEIERDGETLVKEQVVQIEGGREHTFSFDFADEKVASTRVR